MLNVIDRPFSTRAPFSEAFETDLFPLALGGDDIDIGVRRQVAAAAATNAMSHELIGIIARDEETHLLPIVQRARRVKLDHVMAPATCAPDLFFVDDRHA